MQVADLFSWATFFASQHLSVGSGDASFLDIDTMSALRTEAICPNFSCISGHPQKLFFQNESKFFCCPCPCCLRTRTVQGVHECPQVLPDPWNWDVHYQLGHSTCSTFFSQSDSQIRLNRKTQPHSWAHGRKAVLKNPALEDWRSFWGEETLCKIEHSLPSSSQRVYVLQW